MFWYKKPFFYIALSLGLLQLLVFNGCKPPVSTSTSVKYFDLKKYFTTEAARLNLHNKPINKTVNYNGEAETKRIGIKNWTRELDLFIGSDINKPAWKDSYKVEENADSIVYTAIDTNLQTRRIAIRLQAKQVVGIAISNFTKNMLYQTREKLAYYPDSMYYIEKHQAVKLLGTNNYLITGKLK